MQIERLNYLREFCDKEEIRTHREIKDILLNGNQWNQLEKLMAVLAPFKKFTKLIQYDSTTLSDFYGYWISIKVKLSKMESNEIVLALQNEMNRREDSLMNNPSMIGCVYLDPRYQRTLKEDQKNIAIDYLAKLFNRITSIETPIPDVVENPTNIIISEDINELEEYLEEFPIAGESEQVNVNDNNTNTQNNSENIINILRAFNGKVEKPSIRLQHYWQQQKYGNPELYKIVSVLFTIRVTQTTVERAFSALRIILSSHRTNLKSETLQNILLVRLNHDSMKE